MEQRSVNRFERAFLDVLVGLAHGVARLENDAIDAEALPDLLQDAPGEI
jgi:hypothetical protein